MEVEDHNENVNIIEDDDLVVFDIPRVAPGAALKEVASLNTTAVDTIDAPIHFDLAKGIDQVAGSEDLYYEILGMLVDDYSEKSALIRELYEKKDYVNYEIEVHALKSATANLGAMDISSLAKKHEFAVKEDNLHIIDESIDELLSLYKDVIDEGKALIAKRS